MLKFDNVKMKFGDLKELKAPFKISKLISLGSSFKKARTNMSPLDFIDF